MKLIEGMKKIKDLQRKASDLRRKISDNCTLLDYETPEYGDKQKEKIAEWLQAHSDIIKEILKLRIQIQKTNLATSVDIELGGKTVNKTIAEWIHRRRELADLERQAWAGLTDRGLKEGQLRSSQDPSAAAREVKVVRFFNPEERDGNVELYRSETGIVDSTLEVVNAVTDLIE